MPNIGPKLMRVASYNIHKSVGFDRRRNPLRILETINDINADVIALQEVDRRLGERETTLSKTLIREHTDFEPAPISDKLKSIGWHGNTILVRRGTPIITTAKLELPTLEPRGAILIEFDWQGQMVRMISGHFGLTPKYRQKQLQAISDKLKSLPELPTILLGDFNEWRSQKGFEALPVNYKLHTPGKTYPAIRPIVPLDRIATSHSIKVTKASVFKQGRSMIASDHLPVWADLQLETI